MSIDTRRMAELDLGPQRVPAARLREAADNYRELSDSGRERLQHTLKTRPDLLEARPLIVDRTGEILAGNMRYRVGTEDLGWTDFPCFVMDPSPAERREIMVLDNLPFGHTVDEKLAQLVASHKQAGADLANLGMADAEMTSLLKLAGEYDRSGAAGRGDPDADPPPPPEDPRTKLGDVYELGPHLLVCGDSTDREAVVQVLRDGEFADLIVTDPPYGVDYQRMLGRHPGEGATDAEWDEYRADQAEQARKLRRRSDGNLEVANDELSPEALQLLIAAAFRGSFLKEGGAFYCFAPPGRELPFHHGLIDAGMPAKHAIAWVKDRFVLGRADYHYRHETILYGWRPGAAHYFTDDRTQHTVWEVDQPKVSKLHPTMKPSDLCRRAIVNSSRPGEIVYDPFGGSGTTMIAADGEGRSCRMVEIDPRLCDVIVSRWEEYTEGHATLLDRAAAVPSGDGTPVGS